MIKLNRIGNKLGIAGVAGIVLSLCAVFNQFRTEEAVGSATERAERQATIAATSLKTEANLQAMVAGDRNIRLAITVPAVEQALAQIKAAQSDQLKNVDVVLAIVTRKENKDRFQEIRQVAEAYGLTLDEVAKLQTKLLQLQASRSEATANWDKHLQELRSSPAMFSEPAWQALEGVLRNANLELNAIRAAAWRYSALQEDSQKQSIVEHTVSLVEQLEAAKMMATTPEAKEGIANLFSDAEKFQQATEEGARINERKAQINATQSQPAAEKLIALLHEAVAASEKYAAAAKTDAAAQLKWSSQINLVIGLLIVAVLVGSMVFSALGIARPLRKLNAELGEMAAGNTSIEITGATRGDEIGDIAKTVAVIRANAEKSARDEAESRMSHEAAAARQRKQDMVRLADDFEGAVGEIVDTVSSASTELEASATTLTATAERSQQLAQLVAGASEDATSNVQSVASAAEQMSSSITEISRQVQESAKIADEAVEQARQTNARVNEMAEAAVRIGAVVELINSIAGQTNLLALNATIEAARAGDAGRGFAVVASEVKALAEQTAKATGEISQQIGGIQAVTEDSVTAIQQIGGIIGRMSEISASIATAIEEQSAATQEISRNVQNVAQGTQAVNTHILDVQRGAGETGSASTQLLSSAQMLSSDSNRLKVEVARFLDSVRAS